FSRRSLAAGPVVSETSHMLGRTDEQNGSLLFTTFALQTERKNVYMFRLSTGLNRICATPLLVSLSASGSREFESSLLRRQLVRTASRLRGHVRFHRWDVGALPASHFTTCFIENSSVVFQPHFPGSVGIEEDDYRHI